MPKRLRAGRTKTELYEITRSLVLSGKYSIERVVSEFNKQHPVLKDEELRDVLDFGLRTLAGRVRASRSSLSNQYDLLREHEIPEFFELSLQNEDRRQPKLVQTVDLRVEDFDAQAVTPQKQLEAEKKSTGGDNIRKYIAEMRSQGFGGTLGEFLSSR